MKQTNQHLIVCGQRLEVRRIPGPPPGCGQKPAAERPTLVFLHEGLGSISLWRNFPERLAAATGCPALVYSRRGYGNSDPLLPPYRRPFDYLHHEALEVLPALLVQCGIRKPILFGHSDGATIALIYASAPERGVTAVILEAPHVFVEPITLSGIRAICETWRTTDLRQRLARHHRHVDGAFWGWADAWLHPEFEGMTIEALLPLITCPVLVLQGEDDTYGTAAQVERVTTRVSGPASSRLIPNCGHSPHHEQTETVLDASLNFLTRNFP